jgi:hypothetical protein
MQKKNTFGKRKSPGTDRQAKSHPKPDRARRGKRTKSSTSIVRSDVGASSMWDAVKRLFTR